MMTIYQWAQIILGTLGVIVIPALGLWWTYGRNMSRRMARLEASDFAKGERIDRLETDMKQRPDKSDIIELRGALATQTEAIKGVSKVMEAQGAQLGRIHDFLLNSSVGGK